MANQNTTAKKAETTKTDIKPKKKEQKRVLVIIPKPHNVTGDTETTVSVNGEMYQIKYDVPVSVPLNVAEVIETSKELQAKILEETEAAILRPGKQSIAEL